MNKPEGLKEISVEEFIENIEKDDFFDKYGNTVKINDNGKILVAIKWDEYKKFLPPEKIEEIEKEAMEQYKNSKEN